MNCKSFGSIEKAYKYILKNISKDKIESLDIDNCSSEHLEALKEIGVNLMRGDVKREGLEKRVKFSVNIVLILLTTAAFMIPGIWINKINLNLSYLLCLSGIVLAGVESISCFLLYQSYYAKLYYYNWVLFIIFLPLAIKNKIIHDKFSFYPVLKWGEDIRY